jgi:glycosyltransferase involved in cell wall biosynthesis
MPGFVKNDDELRALYNGARGFIMANEEDFGLVTAEAQACGTPVIAYRAGGSTEIVEEGKTGVFFDEQTPESLADAVIRFDSMQFDREYIASRAKKFSVENFRKGINAAVSSLQ